LRVFTKVHQRAIDDSSDLFLQLVNAFSFLRKPHPTEMIACRTVWSTCAGPKNSAIRSAAFSSSPPPLKDEAHITQSGAPNAAYRPQPKEETVRANLCDFAALRETSPSIAHAELRGSRKAAKSQRQHAKMRAPCTHPTK
jgi:hypothetical protein